MKESKDGLIMKILQTVGLIVSTNILWLVIYYLARGAIYLLDLLRGLDNDLIQGLGIELLAPGVALYLSLKICKSIFTNSRLKVGLVLSILFFFVLYFSFGSFIKPTYDSVKTFDTFFKIGFVISIILGGIVSFNEIDKNE